MTYLLAILWFLVISWLLLRWRVAKQLGLRSWVILGLYGCKVLAGIAYGWFFMQMDNYRINADTWSIFFDALMETDWLISDPVAFFRDLITPRYANDTGIMGTENSLLNDLKEVLFIKFIAFINLFTGGRYYVNVVLINGLYTVGLLGFAQAVCLQLGKNAVWAPIVACLFPTVLFWSSGVHKDGLLLAVAGLLLLAAVRLSLQSFRLRWALPVLFGLVLFFLLRPHACLLFVLSCAMLWVPMRANPSKAKVAAAVAGLLIVAAVFYYFNPTVPASWLAARRLEFLALTATDVVSTQTFEGNFRGMLMFLPKAIGFGCFWPLPGMYIHPLALAAGVENAVVLLIWWGAVYALLRRKSEDYSLPFILGCFAYFAATAILVGFTIPYLSPLMRYKSIALPFIIAPSLAVLQHRLILLQQMALAMIKKPKK